jgi:hypothetical protein
VFKGVSQCIPDVSLLYFGQFNPFHCSPWPFSSLRHFSATFSTHPCILYLHRCDVLRYYWWSIILFSFPSFPEFHRAVPLLQTCSTYKFVYDRACFCMCVYLLDLSSTYERKHTPFVFLNLAYLPWHDVLQ